MSGQQYESTGSLPHFQGDDSKFLSTDRRDSVRTTGPSSRNMSVVALMPQPQASLFDRNAGGRFELPPLRHSISYHGPLPAGSSGSHGSFPGAHESVGSEARKRKMHHQDSNQSAPACLESAADPDEYSRSPPKSTPSRRVAQLVTPDDHSHSQAPFSNHSQSVHPSVPSLSNMANFQVHRHGAMLSPYEQGISKSSLQNTKTPGISNLLVHAHSGPPRTINADETSPKTARPSPFSMQRRTSTSPGQVLETHSGSNGNPPVLHATSPEIRFSSANPHRRSPPREESEIGSTIPLPTAGATNSYQMMTLQTSSGTMQVPVDIQAASKIADEKRRRNAGASARFRERRKRKEVESSVAINRLEQQVKDLSEDMEYYRQERDYFVDAILQTPGGDRHFPRPTTSPRLQRRSHVPSTPGSTSGEFNSFDFAQDRQDGMPDGVSMRSTRTMSFSNTPEPSTSGGRPFSFGGNTVTPSAGLSGSSRPKELAHSQKGGFQASDGVHNAPQSAPLPRIQNLPQPWMQTPPTTGPLNPFAGHHPGRHWPQSPPSPRQRSR